ncbi:MAG: hypothetical protein FWF28_00870 [Micrococcales bacterium]|nr:hypothetical protein [Micrococcales bacterium]
MSTLTVVPISLRAANAFVAANHRTHGPVVGAKFAIAARDQAGTVVGVAIVGRPVARLLDDELTAEVTRVCCLEGVPNACSMLYGAAWRACKSMGFRRLVTYTQGEELGTSLRAAGAHSTASHVDDGWDRPARHRNAGTPGMVRTRWEWAA